MPSSLINELNAMRRELHSLLSDKTEGNLRFTNQRYYEYATKQADH